MVTAYLRNTDGSPVTHEDWYFGRFLGRIEATTTLERDVKEGDVIRTHAGHGLFNEWVVEAVDEQTAILVRCLVQA